MAFNCTRIAIDLDDVLVPMVPALFKFYIRTKRAHVYQKKMKEYNYAKYFGISDNESKMLVHDFYNSEEHMNMHPFIGCRNALKNIKSNGTRLCVVTGRQTYAKRQTEDLIYKHFDTLFDDVYLCNSFSLCGEAIPKNEMCIKIGADLLIDDNAHILDGCKCAGLETRLFGMYPWNESSFQHQKIRSWSEFNRN